MRQTNTQHQQQQQQQPPLNPEHTHQQSSSTQPVVVSAFSAFNFNPQTQGYSSSNPLSFTYSDSFHHQKAYSLQSNTSSENEAEVKLNGHSHLQNQQFFDHDSHLSNVQLREPFKVQSENQLTQSNEWYQSPQLGQKSIRHAVAGSEMVLRSEQPRVAFRERQNLHNLHNFDSSQMSDQRLSNGPTYLQARDFFPQKDESPQQFQIQMNHKSHFDHTFHTNQNFLSQSSGIVEFQASRGTSLPPKSISQDDNMGIYSHSKCTANLNPQLLSESFDDFEITKSQILMQQSNLKSQHNKFLGFQAPSPKTSLYAPYSHTSSQSQLRMRQSSDTQVKQQESDYERSSFQARAERESEGKLSRFDQERLLQGVRVISNQSSCSNAESSASQGWHMPQQSQVTFQHNNNNHFTYNYNPSHVQSHDQDQMLKSQLSINSQSSGQGRELKSVIERVIEPAASYFMNIEQQTSQTETGGTQDSRKESRHVYIGTESRSHTEPSEVLEQSLRSRNSLHPYANQNQKREVSVKDVDKLTTQSHHSSITQSSIPPHEKSVNLAQELKEINSAISRSSRRAANDSIITKRETSLEQRQSQSDAHQIINEAKSTMPTSDWLQFLKLVYLQLNKLENQGSQVEADLSKRELPNMVNRDNLIRLIEFNAQKLPLKSVNEIQQVNKGVSYLSIDYVLKILQQLRSIKIFLPHFQTTSSSLKIDMIHWMDILEQVQAQQEGSQIFASQESQIPVEAVPPQPHAKAVIESSYSSQEASRDNQSRVIRLDQVKISENNSGENSVEDIMLTSHLRQESTEQVKRNIVILESESSEEDYQKIVEKQQVENERMIASKVVKIMLKDQSILLDMSKVQEAMQKSQLILSQAVEKTLDGQRPIKLRALSLSQMTLSITQKLHDLNHFQGLVILNLSDLRLSKFTLDQVKLPSVQFLNIANNNLSEIFLSKENFPSLKELIASQNNFRTAKYFSKLLNLRLLDLSENLLDLYEEVICLALLDNLAILSLNGNPLCFLSQGHQCPQFAETVSKLLPKVKMLNPPHPISKASCFENFKDLAFSVGFIPKTEQTEGNSAPSNEGNFHSEVCTLKVQSQMSSSSKQSQHQQSSCQESENTSYVYSKQVNLDNLLSGTNTNTAIVPAPPQDYSQILRNRERANEHDRQKEEDKISCKSSPIKVLYDQNLKSSKRTEIPQNNSPISYGQMQYGHSPCLTESKATKRASPQRVVITKDGFNQIDTQSSAFIKIANINRNESHSKERRIITDEANVITQTSESQEGNTFDSNKQQRLEDAQQIPVKNDHLKYFNLFSKDTTPPDRSERGSLHANLETRNLNKVTRMQDVSGSKSRDLNKSVEDSIQQKPPRYIKIKPTSSMNYSGYVNSSSFVDSSNPFSPRLSDKQLNDSSQKKQDQTYQSKGHNSVLLQQSGGGKLAIGINSENDQTLLSQVAELHQNLMEQNRRSYHQAIRRDMSVKLSSSTAKTSNNLFYPSSQEGNNSLLSQPRIRREQSAFSVSPVLNQKQFSYTQNSNTPSQHNHQLFSSFKMQQSDGRGYSELIDADDTQSDMANYYENSKQLMNVKRIREMPSKELCKVQNINQGRGLRGRNDMDTDNSMSPMKAMMISKPPDDEEIQRSASRNSNAASRQKQLNFYGNSSSVKRGNSKDGSFGHKRADNLAASHKSNHRAVAQKCMNCNATERIVMSSNASVKRNLSNVSNLNKNLTPQVRGRYTQSNQRSITQTRISSFTHIQDITQSRVNRDQQQHQLREVRSNQSQVGVRQSRLAQDEDENQDLEYSNITSLSAVTNRGCNPLAYGHRKQPSQSSALTQPIMNEDYGNLGSSVSKQVHQRQSNSRGFSQKYFQKANPNLQDSSSKNSGYALSSSLIVNSTSQRSGRSQLRNYKKSQMILKNAGNQLRVSSKQQGREKVKTTKEFDPRGQGKHQQIMKCLEDFNGGSPKINTSELTQNTQDVRPFNIPTEDDSSTPKSKNFAKQIRNKSEFNAQCYNKQRNESVISPPLERIQNSKINFDRQLSQARTKESQSERILQNQDSRAIRMEKNDEKMLMEDLTSDNKQYPEQQHQNLEGQNTPRFSQRMNLQKELRYQGAVELINCKRKKKEQKKQLYNSMLGKQSHNAQTRGQNTQQRSRQASNYSQSRVAATEYKQNQREASPNLGMSKLNQSQRINNQGFGMSYAQQLNQSGYSNYQSGEGTENFQSNERQVNIEVVPGVYHHHSNGQGIPTHYESSAGQRGNSIGAQIHPSSSILNGKQIQYYQHQNNFSSSNVYSNSTTNQFDQRNSSIAERNAERGNKRQGGLQLSQTQKQLSGGYLQFNVNSQSRQQAKGCANKLSIDLRPQRK